MNEITSLKDNFLKELNSIQSLNELQSLRARYIGKKGLITQKLKSLSQLSQEERPAFGKSINEIKSFIETRIKEKESQILKREIERKTYTEGIDITLPGYQGESGSRHPVSIVLNDIIDIFITMGFSVEYGPEIETDYYNFEALNMPKNHPARDMQDTFYIETGDRRQSKRPSAVEETLSEDSHRETRIGKIEDIKLMKYDKGVVESDVVLRTHTSPVQIRVMEREKPPLMFISPGKVYRCDVDISHTPLFHQVEGLMVDTDITFSNLKAVLEGFLHIIFSPDVPVRFRPSFFPFTEPSAEVDIGCILCKGSGCRVCKWSGWLEILGAGMVNPKVFQMVKYDINKYTGFAFGMGIERITMLKFGIDDIRLFYESDLRFLRQFR